MCAGVHLVFLPVCVCCALAFLLHVGSSLGQASVLQGTFQEIACLHTCSFPKDTASILKAQDHVKSIHCNIGGMPYPSALAQDLSACPPNTRQAGDAEQCDKAKSGRPESLACSIIDDMTTPACNTLWQEESTVGMQHLFWFYAECTRKWQQLWSLPVSQSRKVR